MRRLKKNFFLGSCASMVGILAIIRICNPSVMSTMQAGTSHSATDSLLTDTMATTAHTQPTSIQKDEVQPMLHSEKERMGSSMYPNGTDKPWHKLGSVSSYEECFPDAQDVQIKAAMQWGVNPVANREEAESRKNELVFVGADPYFSIDKNMRHSIPYLVPRAHDLLCTIGKNFLDSLYVKGIPLHRIIVSSVLRTEDDVTRLRRHNGNASEQSCHRFGTTFDIAYNRYSTVSHPEGPERRTVRNDTLKWVLSQVLRDIRRDSLCYVKHERKQGCFHITVR